MRTKACYRLTTTKPNSSENLIYGDIGMPIKLIYSAWTNTNINTTTEQNDVNDSDTEGSEFSHSEWDRELNYRNSESWMDREDCYSVLWIEWRNDIPYRKESSRL